MESVCLALETLPVGALRCCLALPAARMLHGAFVRAEGRAITQLPFSLPAGDGGMGECPAVPVASPPYIAATHTSTRRSTQLPTRHTGHGYARGGQGQASTTTRVLQIATFKRTHIRTHTRTYLPTHLSRLWLPDPSRLVQRSVQAARKQQGRRLETAEEEKEENEEKEAISSSFSSGSVDLEVLLGPQGDTAEGGWRGRVWFVDVRLFGPLETEAGRRSDLLLNSDFYGDSFVSSLAGAT